jgi:hopanoid biosynthesis associated RND transporter like protein HpnN
MKANEPGFPLQSREATGKTNGLRSSILESCARLTLKRPITLLSIALLTAVTGALLAATLLDVDADTNSLISDDRPFMKTYRAFMEDFGDLEYIYIVVDAGEPADHSAAESAVIQLLKRLQSEPDLAGVRGRISPEELWRMAPRAMPLADLEELLDASTAFAPILERPTPSELLEEADADLRELVGDGLTMDETTARTLGAKSLFMLEALAAAPARPGDPWSSFELAAPRSSEFLRSSTGRMYFVEILPQKDYGSLAVIEEPLARIREVIDSVQANHPTIQIGLTGKPVLQADEMAITRSDMTRASIIALTIIALLFMIVFRGVRRPLLAVLAFAAAFGWTYGLATLLVGRLNLLSMVFMLVLVGVGLDYGVHMVARWNEARRHGSAAEANRHVMHTAVVGNLTGAVTSAGVFLLALLTSFQGLRELGLIAGLGLLMCLAAMTLVLPALLVLTERGSSPTSKADIEPSDHATRHQGRRIPTLVIAAAAILCTWFVFVVPEQLRFESNLLELQAKGLESVQWEHRLFEDDTSASWFAAAITDSIDELPTMTRKASEEPAIGRVMSVLDLVALPSPERALVRARLGETTRRPTSRSSPATSTPLEPLRLKQVAGRLGSLAFISSGRVSEQESQRIRDLAERLEEQARVLSRPDPATSEPLRRRIKDGLDRTADALQQMGIGASGSLRKSLPAALRARLISPEDSYLLMMQPKENVWNHDAMGEFVSSIRRVDPEATGVPITQYESMNDMARAFTIMAVGAILVVALVVWLDFRSVISTLFCMGSLAVGILWTLGLLALFSIPLNLANFFAIPILIGLGTDSSIHVLHRWRDMHRNGESHYGATLRAVALTAVTTGIGFGALLTAQHKGLQSLGWVMAIGSIACLLSAVIVLPQVLKIAPQRMKHAMLR